MILNKTQKKLLLLLLRKRKIEEKQSELRGKNLFVGLVLGVLKLGLMFFNALKRLWCLEVGHLVQLWLYMLQIEKQKWKLICSYVILKFVNLSMKTISIVNIFQIISYQIILLPQLMPSLLFKFTGSFLESIVDYVDPALPFISLSKGLELNTLRMMSQIIPQALKNPRQPFVALSGPSFASELMDKLPTAMVVASRDKKLVNEVQQLLTSERLRINTSSDVTGVEIAGALKNVLAIAAGIVEGMNLGNNSMAALVAQGCSEIRWLAKKMGAKSATLTGLSGTGDIMLTCFVSLSRNRTVGVRLGSGERLEDILSSMNQVAEGVATAGAVIALAQKYNVKMPVLTAVARIIDNELTPQAAVLELMSLPQVEEV
ncbi:glycerol-3-phosphate dehydrogenase [NAD(+)] 2, chloroplastic isoform X3 [Beta vulgaris subsp. vulgaris]|uniref:glycerol-3-phosphate dehydrogenase [NAD(+)] 2, chloroplastic isoform X3 n=1 Tax=Beta vulgaris subsp. vulgaris TaxID=3555 RepID=UPI002036E547|nr:glycerol-3-phosphate dehydrogenase [NAD(+)] 2, chloroplastic isoform X3 [Beta vulgaris subsp. vulgaris]